MITVHTGFGGEQFTVGGEFRPGNPTGIFTVGPGRLGLATTALTVFEISTAGTAEVRATTQLRGRLRLVVAPGSNLVPGTTLPLFTGRVSGTFTEIETVGLPADRLLDVRYLPESVTAEVRAR